MLCVFEIMLSFMTQKYRCVACGTSCGCLCGVTLWSVVERWCVFVVLLCQENKIERNANDDKKLTQLNLKNQKLIL